MTKYLLILALCLMGSGTPAVAQQGKGKPAQNVIVTPAHIEDFADRVEALGTLRANESVVLTATVTETVRAVNFEDGQRVKKGDVLVEMRGGEEKAELAGEQATLSEAKRQMERLQPLVATGAASQAQLDERKREYQTANARLDAIRSRIGDRIVTAPFDGVLGLRNISVGAVVQPGTRITTLDDDSVMKLDFAVPALYLETLKPGLDIIATASAFKGRSFKGKVASVDSQIDPVTRSISVRALVPNEGRVLKPGLLMNVEILKDPRQAVVVPEESILAQGEKNFVFVAGGYTAQKIEIETGARQPGMVEVTKGLKGGEMVITHGTMTLADGAPIKIVGRDDGKGASLARMLKEGAEPAAGDAAPKDQKAR